MMSINKIFQMLLILGNFKKYRISRKFSDYCSIFLSGNKARKILTEAQKWQAIGIYKSCKTYDETVRLCRKARIFISKSGVGKVVRRWKETGTVADRSRPGRPRSTRKEDETCLKRIALRNRHHSLPKLREELRERKGVGVSRQTITRRLKEAGLSRRVAVKRPLLTANQKERRVAFAENYRTATNSFWSRVGFSDEKVFQAGGQNTKCLVTRRSSEKFHPKCIRRTPKRGVQIHVWGFISWHGMGPLRLVNGNLDAQRYQAEIIPDIQQICSPLGPDRKKLIFQQDNAPAHSARSTRNFLAQKGVTLLDWPGNSPDLNPIEHVMAHVSRRVRPRGLPRNKDEFWGWVQEAWRETPISYIHSLYRSMRSRVNEVLENAGDSTHY